MLIIYGLFKQSNFGDCNIGKYIRSSIPSGALISCFALCLFRGHGGVLFLART